MIPHPLSRLLAVLLPAALGAALPAQQPSQPPPVNIYTPGPGIAAPQLLPSAIPHTYANGNCRVQEDGTATFAVIVDATGQPRNIYFQNPIGDDLDLIALKEVLGDRFKPGAQGSAPVAVATSIAVTLHTCLTETKNAQGKSQDVLELSSAPVQELKPPVDPPRQALLVSGSGLSANPADPEAGIVENPAGDVMPPVQFPPTKTTLAEASRLLRGQYKVSVVVDRYGLPQRLRILDAELPGQEHAIAGIVRLFRWKPAMKDGAPVPARTTAGLGSESHPDSSRRR